MDGISGAVFTDENAWVSGKGTTIDIVASFADGKSEIQGNPNTRVTIFNLLHPPTGEIQGYFFQHSPTATINNMLYAPNVAAEGTALEYYGKIYGGDAASFNELAPTEFASSAYARGANTCSSGSYEDTFMPPRAPRDSGGIAEAMNWI